MLASRKYGVGRYRCWPVRLFAVAALACAIIPCGGCRAQERRASNEIEVSLFQGGYGLQFFLDVARQYEKAHPGVKVNLWGDPRNDEKLRPRFIAGNPPDLVWASIPLWVLVAEGQVCPLDRQLAGPAYDDPHKTWRETFRSDALTAYSDGKHTYAVPVASHSFGVWYNVEMFRDHGWQPPRTWSEFIKLCDVIGRTPNPAEPGRTIDPIAFQGAYIGYILPVMQSLIMSIGGPQAWADCVNLKPAAWSRPEVIRALRLTQKLRRKKYIRDEYMGMSHLESQREFVIGNAAFVFCGTWLKNEMASSTPEGFHMAFLPIPPVEGGKGDPSAVPFGGDCWFVPARARHPEQGADFLRFMTQQRFSERFARQVNALMSIKGGDKGLPAELQGAVDALKSARYTFSTEILSVWYPRFGMFLNDGAYRLITLRASPKQTAALLDAAAHQMRRDPTVVRHHLRTPGAVR